MNVPASARTSPLGLFDENIQYTRDLIAGGVALEALQSSSAPNFLSLGKDLPADLYRAAWSQAVAAMDHWLHDEIIERAVILANDTGNVRPPSMTSLKMPFAVVERMRNEAIHVVFKDFLESEFRRRSFHTVEDITGGIKLVTYLSSNDIWATIGQAFNMTRDQVKQHHDNEIIKRRNDIAHRADRDAKGQRQPMSEQQSRAAVDWISGLVYELLGLLG